MAQVALCYTVNANLIFKWLRDPKYRPGAGPEESGLRFLPVEIVADPIARTADPARLHLFNAEGRAIRP